MSVLGRRMRAGPTSAGYRPYGTGATPMVMPLAVVSYENEQALYQTLHPLVTADGAVVPGANDVYWPEDVPAGRA